MLAPNWILGGILAGMLGLTGLVASAETPALPGENLVPSASAAYITASLPVVPVPPPLSLSHNTSTAAVLASLHATGSLPTPPVRSEETLRINAVFRLAKSSALWPAKTFCPAPAGTSAPERWPGPKPQ